MPQITEYRSAVVDSFFWLVIAEESPSVVPLAANVRCETRSEASGNDRKRHYRPPLEPKGTGPPAPGSSLNLLFTLRREGR